MLAALLLFLNDSIFKQRWPGLMTGKVSDVVGPVVLAVLIAVALGRTTSAVRGAVALSAGFMMAIKLSTTIANEVAEVLAVTTGIGHQIIADPTDLIGLVGLVVVGPIIANPRPFIDRRFVRFAGLALGLYATVATSAVEYDSHDKLGLVDGQVIAYDATTDFSNNHSVLVFTNGEWVEDIRSFNADLREGGEPTPYCLKADESICVKSEGAYRVLESSDGGSTWKPVFAIDDTEGWLSSTNTDVNPRSNDGPGEVLELDDGTLIVSMGEIDPIIRSPLGSWSPTDIDARTFPFWEWLMLAATSFGLIHAAVLVLRARARLQLVIPAVLILLATTPWGIGAGLFWIGGESADLLTGFLIVAGACGWLLFAIATLIAWIETYRTEERGSMIIGLTATSSVAAVALTSLPLLLWLNGVIDWPVARFGSLILALLATIAATTLVLTRRSETKPQPPAAAAVDQFGVPGVDAPRPGL